MNLQVLLSCMFRNEFSIINNSNLENVNTLIINQCGEDRKINLDKNHEIINTKTRGLSISRNLALNNATGDICLLCDDDECFIEDLEKQIIKVYKNLKNADVIIFRIKNYPNKLGNKVKCLSKWELMRVSSQQISFKRKSICDNNITFDPNLGAGTERGSGEENKFLLDCYKKGLKIYFVPIDIVIVKQGTSTWFFGYNDEYFLKKGSSIRYIYGVLFSVIYAIYFIMTKKDLYKKNISSHRAFYFMIKGIMDKTIKEKKD